MFPQVLRTGFDIDKGEHPAEELVKTLTSSMYDPIQTWLVGLDPFFANPLLYKFPVP